MRTLEAGKMTDGRYIVTFQENGEDIKTRVFDTKENFYFATIVWLDGHDFEL